MADTILALVILPLLIITLAVARFIYFVCESVVRAARLLMGRRA